MSETDYKKSKVSMMLDKGNPVSKSQMRLEAHSRLRMRKASFGFTGVAGIRPVERTSMVAIEFKRPVMQFLPTYQLDPLKPFHIPTVTKATDDILDEHFSGHVYNIQESPGIAMRIAGELMRKIKAMTFNRYRIISVVTIGQKRSQSYNNAISFLWDHERDSYVDVHREATTAFIQVTTFGIYLD